MSANNFNLQKLMNNYKLCLCHVTCSKTALLLCYLVQTRRQHQLTFSELTNLPLNQDSVHFKSGFVHRSSPLSDTVNWQMVTFGGDSVNFDCLGHS